MKNSSPDQVDVLLKKLKENGYSISSTVPVQFKGNDGLESVATSNANGHILNERIITCLIGADCYCIVTEDASGDLQKNPDLTAFLN